MDQSSLPIIEALQQHAESLPDSFHVPGHKNGTVQPAYARDILSAARYDQTELPGLDDLHDPRGVIASAQKLTAEVYGSRSAFFLIGGSTAGNLIMILAALQEGDVVLVQRDIHKSIINGLRLVKAQPVFLDPEYDAASGLSLGLNVHEVQKAFYSYPKAAGLIVNRPGYYGWTSPLRAVIEEAKHHGAVVLADEAHGAHFPAGDVFPDSALSLGADLVVHSAHKTLPALTMTGFLHVGGAGTISPAQVQEAAAMVESSSPSYLLLASLDAARKYLYELMRTEDAVLQKQLEQTKHAVLQAGALEERIPPEHIRTDPLKIVARAPQGYTGWALQRYLEEEQVFTELADEKHVVFFLSFEPLSTNTLQRIERGAARLRRENPSLYSGSGVRSFPPMGMQQMPADWYQAGRGETQTKALRAVEQEQAAIDIIPYPPGIPLFLKGEILTGKRLNVLLERLEQGGDVQGVWRGENGQWLTSIVKRKET
ncbi:aminotransferase class I/II-fold pyridoxal phosphate-dependent enzyme [Salibacterium lacus]|uniref:Aminotransferase class I/II-fold pyridoxal phosphate-dependent enzyme n=1 Tax=Salibacterium lacus TaxID=1898109 RepID=A0ABW5T3V3_9BACI